MGNGSLIPISENVGGGGGGGEKERMLPVLVRKALIPVGAVISSLDPSKFKYGNWSVNK